MSDDDADTPLDIPQSDCDDFPEVVGNSARNEDSRYVWAESHKVIKKFGYGPLAGDEDSEDIPEDFASESEEEVDSDNDDNEGKLPVAAVYFLPSFMMLTRLSL